MIDDKDIKKIIEATTKANKETFATKDDFNDLKSDLISTMEKVFPTKVVVDKRFDDIRKDFSDLQTSVDVYAKKADTYFQEMVVINNNYRRLEGWIHQVAEKVGVDLKY